MEENKLKVLADEAGITLDELRKLRDFVFKAQYEDFAKAEERIVKELIKARARESLKSVNMVSCAARLWRGAHLNTNDSCGAINKQLRERAEQLERLTK